MKIPPINTIGNFINKNSAKIGEKLVNTVTKSSDSFQKFTNLAKNSEFTGMNYPFWGMTAIMFFVVLIPRLKAAFTRKTDNKKAIWDEVREILFRDLQTIIIMLLVLNGVSAMLTHGKSKQSGLPLTNKPLKKVFETNGGLIEKTKEFITHPIKISKTILSNIGSAMNPLGGVSSLTNDEITSRYSGFSNLKDVSKMLDGIEYNGGDKNKIFSQIIKSITENIEKTQKTIKQQALNSNQIDGSGKIINEALKNQYDGTVEILNKLKSLANEKTSGLENLLAQSAKQDKTANAVSNLIVEYLKDPNNSLAMEGRKNGAIFRTCALAMEASYLGFGLPALYKLGLKRKYLNENPKSDKAIQEPIKINSSSLLINKKLSFKENSIYRNFVK